MSNIYMILLATLIAQTLACTTHDDCPVDKACRQNKCIDPCPGACGDHTECHVLDHIPQCCCKPGYLGDAFTGCVARPSFLLGPGIENACRSFPCGINAQRSKKYVAAYCSCLPGYHGDPYVGCAPGAGCELDQDCSPDKLCAHHKCHDPCHSSTCGNNSKCTTVNHSPRCDCLPGHEGDPLFNCHLKSSIDTIELPESEPLKPDKCTPNPCGSFATCASSNGSCSCISGYFGDPHKGCRPECHIHEDCPLNKACELNSCIDPCLGFCDVYSDCLVVDHLPSCANCVDGFDGNGGCQPNVPVKSYSCPSAESIAPCVCSIRRGNSHRKDRGILACSGPHFNSDSVSRAVTAFQNLNNATKAVIILH